ncbi:MAG: arylsulfatase [Novosphingobium sp.]|nr:arylsulfatase [Novosphingobium sp.]
MKRLKHAGYGAAAALLAVQPGSAQAAEQSPGQVDCADDSYHQPEAFQGRIEPLGKDSQSWWPQDRRAPKGAPNVIIWLLDDVGFGQIGAFGGLIATPNIDAVAARGLLYNNFHSTSLCSPSRASLLTGRNHHAVGVGSHSAAPAGFPGYSGQVKASAGSVARILGRCGYTTFAAGKWDQLPGKDASVAGPFDQWPSGQGFDHFRGFLAADTNNFQPSMWADHTPIDPQLERAGYHLSTDMADTAIHWITGQRSAAPERPWFLYWATGASHAPHHAPQTDIDAYKGRFDMGWDVARERVLANQKRRGIVPANAVLPPRPAELPAWDSLSVPDRKLAARQMEAMAAQLTHADREFGRIVEMLERTGQLDNTIILVTADNGASAEGGPVGTYNEVRNLSGSLATTEQNRRFHDAWGSAEVHNHYAAGWALAGNTPFNFYKQSTAGGGVNAPMVLSWPKGIAARGETRSQFSHINDVMPTLLEVIGIAPPRIMDGVKQQRIDGVSLAYSFAEPRAPERHTVQYFELFGNRGIYADGWKAVALATTTPWDFVSPRDPAGAQWKLYDLRKDFNERRDLASERPDKLKELLAIFDREARANNVYPIGNNYREKWAIDIKDQMTIRDGAWVFHPPGATRIPYSRAAPVYGNSFTVDADLTLADGKASGVVMAQGGNTGGYALWFDNGVPVFTHNYFGEHRYDLRAGKALGAGNHSIRVEFVMRADRSAEAVLRDGGVEIGRSAIPMVQMATSGLNDVFDIGEDSGTPVSDRYAVPNVFSGTIRRVTVAPASPRD